MAENPKCSEQDCIKDAEFLCSCNYPTALLCVDHLHKDQTHTPVAIYKSVSENDQKIITQLCNKCRKDCKALSLKIIEESRNAISLITTTTIKLLNNIREIDLLYENILAHVNTSSRVLKNNYQGELTLPEKIISSQAGNDNIISCY